MSNTWQIADGKATFANQQVAVQVSVSKGHPSAGLRTTGGDDLAELWVLRQLRGLPLLDCYARERDLVASYGPSDSFPFHTELRWSLLTLDVEPEPVIALSLLVSVRTDLLDTHPEVVALTFAPGQSLSAIETDEGNIYWGAAERFTLVDFAMAEDCENEDLELCKANLDVLQRELFSHFLEKGVIRRARLFAALLPSDATEDGVLSTCEAFLATELPLAT